MVRKPLPKPSQKPKTPTRLQQVRKAVKASIRSLMSQIDTAHGGAHRQLIIKDRAQNIFLSLPKPAPGTKSRLTAELIERVLIKAIEKETKAKLARRPA